MLPTIGGRAARASASSPTPPSPPSCATWSRPDRPSPSPAEKPQAVTSPLGPALRLADGRHRRSGRAGRRRVRRALLVRRLGPGHRHRRRRAPRPHGRRERLPRLGPLDEGQPCRGADHQLLEPGRPAGPGAGPPCSRKAGTTSSSPTTARGRRRASRSTTTARPRSVYEEVDSLRGSIRTKTPLRLNRRSTGEGAGGAAVHDIRFYRRALPAPEVQVLGRRLAFEAALAAQPSERTKEQLKPLRDYYLAFLDADARRLREAREALVAELEAVKARSKVTLVAEEKKGRKPFAHILVRGQYDQEGEKVGAAVPAVLPAAARGCPRQSAGSGALADRSGPSAHGPRQRQSLLGAGLRARHRRHRGGVRHHRGASHEPEAARLAGRRVPRVRMEREGPLPADGDVRRRTASPRPRRRRSSRRTRTIACSPGGRASGCTAR